MRYVLLLGSNRDDGMAQMARACDALARAWTMEAAGPARQTDGVAPDRAHRYANQAVRIAQVPGRDALKQQLKRIEADLGRGTEAPDSGIVALDIDIVAAYDDAGMELWRDASKTPSAELRGLVEALAPAAGPTETS